MPTLSPPRAHWESSLKHVDRKFWVIVYLALGWMVVVALKPMINHLAWYALLLLLVGGILYSTGVIF